MPEDERLVEALTLLATGSVEVKGRMPWSSNATFLVEVSDDGQAIDAVYKPLRGERPLWDFPPGLYKREVAAYVLDASLGWGHVPETIVRHDLPFGVGSLQRFVDADFGEHYFTLLDDERNHEQLREFAVFDLVANNADRKGGHCLLGANGHIWAIDHGVCFADEPKLRTVIWDFEGQPLPETMRSAVERFVASDMPDALCELLSDREVDALRVRARAVAGMRALPAVRGERPYPWPLV